MASHDNYVHFDELEGLPAPNRENYEFELDFFSKRLPKNASVLQVGSMDGARILRFLKTRPDLKFAGLELEQDLVEIARQNTQKVNCDVTFINADITSPPKNLRKYDFVLCLNNTLGYIPDYRSALRKMREIGDTFVSVYGKEAFDDALATAYFHATGMEIERIDGNQIYVRGVGVIRRFPREEVESWGSEVDQTPIGYIVKVR